MEQDYSKERTLVERFNKGLTAPEENACVNQAFNEFAKSAADDFSDTNIDGIRDKIWAKLPLSAHAPTPIVKRLWPRIVTVAASVALAVLGIWFYHTNYMSGPHPQSADILNSAQDLPPGSVGATLTLANGQKIRLADAENGTLAKEAGVTITKSADGQLKYEVASAKQQSHSYNTLSTAKGETYRLRLPDGSMVYLNAASSLTYMASLIEHGKRVVKLQGEGYFEITKDKTHPFIVQTGQQEIEVLGTHFNINAYGDEPAIATTLIEGSVRVMAPSLYKDDVILKPGQQAINTGKSIKVAEANIENITDWKDGDFYFEHVDFRAVMRKISRWYDVAVIYDTTVPENMTSNGVISRNNTLSAVLKSIEKSGQVHFKVAGKKVYVTQ